MRFGIVYKIKIINIFDVNYYSNYASNKLNVLIKWKTMVNITYLIDSPSNGNIFINSWIKFILFNTVFKLFAQNNVLPQNITLEIAGSLYKRYFNYLIHLHKCIMKYPEHFDGLSFFMACVSDYIVEVILVIIIILIIGTPQWFTVTVRR